METFSKENKNVKCLKLVRNRGKGHAVKMGMMSARGAKIFFADADRAMPFTEFQKINKVLQDYEDTHQERNFLVVIWIVAVVYRRRIHELCSSTQ